MPFASQDQVNDEFQQILQTSQIERADPGAKMTAT